MLAFDDFKLQGAGQKGAAKHGSYAYFPGTGPAGCHCRSCGYLKIKDREMGAKGTCAKHGQLVRGKSSPIDAGTPACKYYERAQ